MVVEAANSFLATDRVGFVPAVLRVIAGLVAAMILVAMPLPMAHSAELAEFTFTRSKQRYEVTSTAYIDVPPEGVFAVLIDYSGLHQISSLVVASTDLGIDEDGRQLVYTHNKGCLALFCRSLEKVEHLEAEPFTLITAVALPERSDVAFSRSEWRLQKEGRGTRLDYHLVTDINFWVPPFIGNYVLSRWLKKGAARAVERIEYYAWHQLYGEPDTANEIDAHEGDTADGPSDLNP